MNAWDYLAAAVTLAAFLLVLGASLAGMGQSVKRHVVRRRNERRLYEELTVQRRPLVPTEPGSLERLVDNGWDFFFNEEEPCYSAGGDESEPRCLICGGESGGLDECLPCWIDGERAADRKQDR